MQLFDERIQNDNRIKVEEPLIRVCAVLFKSPLPTIDEIMTSSTEELNKIKKNHKYKIKMTHAFSYAIRQKRIDNAPADTSLLVRELFSKTAFPRPDPL